MSNAERYQAVQHLEDILWCMKTLISFPGGMDYPGCVEGLCSACNEARSVTWELAAPPRVASSPRASGMAHRCRDGLPSSNVDEVDVESV